jgi:N-acylneuraminate cytidylyltransferase/CMP-N,N'-diacetyllegionaminic acid synthase
VEAICIIPARSGSKGIPDKNVYLLNGKPLIAYSIEAALASPKIKRVIVSTDSESYAEIARQYGADVPFIRPPELAGDEVHSIFSVIHCLEWLQEKERYYPELVVKLLPTAPLRKTKHIDEAVELYKQKGSGSVISVCLADKSPRYYRRIVSNHLVPYEAFNNINYQRQDLESIYQLNGSIYISTPQIIIKNRTFQVEETYPYVMDRKYSIDIDDCFDLKIAEFLLQRR